MNRLYKDFQAINLHDLREQIYFALDNEEIINEVMGW